MPSATASATRSDVSTVRARGATRVYGTGSTAVRAIDGIDVDIPAGQFAAIMGPSGSGKSTLLHCMAGLDRLTDGTVTIAGTDLSSLDDRRLTVLRREQVGFVFQAYNLVPTLDARANITLPVDLGGGNLDQAWFDQVVDVLGLRDRLTHRPSQLSGGQQQRVAAARALITRPAVVFADEPTGALDSNSSAELLGFLRRASVEFGQTVVMVTHDPVAASYAERILFLKDGRFVDELRDPDPDSVLDRMKRLEHQSAAEPTTA
jgi:putative ABC transport system ATP-binding protein